jgi:hypothetical protein
VVLTATPALGSKFGNWSDCDSVSGNQCTKTVTADVAVTAQFDPKEPEVVQHGASKVWGLRSAEVNRAPVQFPLLYKSNANDIRA